MKRLIVLPAILLLAVASAFANVELDLNLYIAPLSQTTLDDEFDTKVKLQYPIGLDTKWAFMIGAPAPFVDIGIKWGYALDFFWNVDTKINGHHSDTSILGIGGNMTLGPVIRFNLGDWHTLYLSPALMGKVSIGAYDKTSYDAWGNEDTTKKILLGVAFAFDLDVGYRIWLVNRVGFHWGFDVGVDMNWPLIAKDYFDGDGVDVDGGGEYKIYLGFAFNFGDKSPDKWR